MLARVMILGDPPNHLYSAFLIRFYSSSMLLVPILSFV